MLTVSIPVDLAGHIDDCHVSASRLLPIEDYVQDRVAGLARAGAAVTEARGFNFEVDHGYFERVVWPAVARRFPVFQAAKCHRTWSGLYEVCEIDGNPIIGNGIGNLENFYVIAGFSGHGMMQAPASGRAIAELIVHGGFQTMNLARFGYARVETGERRKFLRLHLLRRIAQRWGDDMLLNRN